MKKAICSILLATGLFLSVSAQPQPYENTALDTANIKKTETITAPKFHNIIRFKPAAAILSFALYRAVDVVAAYVRYVHPRIGIPLEVEYAYIYGMSGFSILTGIEAVPAIHQEKSGLYLNLEAGIVYMDGYVSYAGVTNIGYQLVTKRGFVFTPAMGVRYDGISEQFQFNLMLDIGFAF